MLTNKLFTPQIFTPHEASRLYYTAKSFDFSKTDKPVVKLFKYVIATSLLPVFLIIDASRLMANQFRIKRQYTALEQLNYASRRGYSKIKSSAKSLVSSALENKSIILKVVGSIAFIGALYIYKSYSTEISTPEPIPESNSTGTSTQKVNSLDIADSTEIPVNPTTPAPIPGSNITRFSTQRVTSFKDIASNTTHTSTRYDDFSNYFPKTQCSLNEANFYTTHKLLSILLSRYIGYFLKILTLIAGTKYYLELYIKK